MQTREKVGKSRNTVFFQWFVAPEGRKVSSLKRRVRSQLARWEMKNVRRCGAKHISKSKCTKHLGLGPLLEVEMSKKCTPLWRKHISKSKCAKHLSVGATRAQERLRANKREREGEREEERERERGRERERERKREREREEERERKRERERERKRERERGREREMDGGTGADGCNTSRERAHSWVR